MLLVRQFVLYLSLIAPSVVVAQTVVTPHQQFIQKVANSARISNQAILADRASIEEYYHHWQQTQNIYEWDLKWLTKIAEKYGIKNIDFNTDATWQALLSRVDVIPVSLVIAQAANESDWGRSRFAKEANNYFGIHCMTLGCGLVPKKRNTGETFEVQRFSNLTGSVQAYMLMLNSRAPYHPLRVERVKLRSQNKTISGHVLAKGLAYFSENPQYVNIIQSVIKSFKLDSYDNAGILT